jgi:hypothetical protein
VFVQERCGDEGDGGVKVHGQLPAIDIGARDKGQEAVDTGHLVDDLEESNNLRAGAKGHFLEESLGIHVSRRGVDSGLSVDVPSGAESRASAKAPS